MQKKNHETSATETARKKLLNILFIHTCLINRHARLFISQKNSTLSALIRNCPFIKFSKKWHPARLLSLLICKIEVSFHSISCSMMSNLPLLTTTKYTIRWIYFHYSLVSIFRHISTSAWHILALFVYCFLTRLTWLIHTSVLPSNWNPGKIFALTV